MNCENANTLTMITLLIIIFIGFFIIIWVKDGLITAFKVQGAIVIIITGVFSVYLGIMYFYEWLLC
jgi:hypothetical protein